MHVSRIASIAPRPVPAKALDPAVAAALRALPIARLQDYGLDHADALLVHEHAAAGLAWPDIAQSLSRNHRAAAAAFDRAGLPTAARADDLYSAVAINACQIPVSDPDVKAELYTTLAAEVSRVGARPGAPWRVLRDGSDGLYALIGRPPGSDPTPTVLVWGGLSGWGVAYLRLARRLVQHGITAVLVELPGQGLPRFRSDRRLTPSFVEDVAELCTALRDDGTASTIGLLGNSAGGLFAAHAAAALGDVDAVCLNSGTPNPTWLVERFPRLRDQWSTVVGVLDEDLDPVLASWAFPGLGQRLRNCDLLVLHGGQDVLVTEEHQHAFLDVADPDRSSLVIWTDCGHCSYERYQQRDEVIWAWFNRALR